ncbi:MAG: creatininase family protein [Ignavibacteriae bacterium]|nr:creatininase family protein [Ignavibacteriota bacterium]
MSPRHYILAETTWQSVQQRSYAVAILPWGATEAHNYHLPYGTDVIETNFIAAESARRAWEAGASVLVLPTIPFGVQTGQLDIPFCINMNPSTQAALLSDVIASLERHQVQKLVILNGHGGNDFKAMIRELQPKTSMLLCTINWWNCLDTKPYFDEPGDHAGELETSVMMHAAPQLVLALDAAGDGREHRSTVKAFREGWAWTPRPWTKISDDTGVGNPKRATAEKGKAFSDAVAERIASFLVELAAANPNELYER